MIKELEPFSNLARPGRTLNATRENQPLDLLSRHQSKSMNLA
jgi:hypothetical protein